MTEIQALILGVVQGLTEFLPVSSSGHLLIFEKIFNVHTESMLTLNILLHVGTLLAIFVVYWERIWNMICHPLQSELKWLVVATIPAVIAALVVDFDSAFEGDFIGISYMLTTLILIFAQYISKVRRETRSLHKSVRWYDSVAMGVMQAVAILPGVSRSGSTIAAGVTTGLSRKRAADFSFLMSIPAILGSAVLDLKDLVLGDAQMVSVGLAPTLIGMAAAAISGFLAIKFMLTVIRKISFNWFALYTFLLGAFLLVNRYVIHILPV
ncbi:MAG: undecaprenyl-diphosphate phosphatase [Clostridia bacterium]|nr:undecaprenyl-diphosphate phosphatase [Clostridia bacterium]